MINWRFVAFVLFAAVCWLSVIAFTVLLLNEAPYVLAGSFSVFVAREIYILAGRWFERRRAETMYEAMKKDKE